jgi:biopolymer transport protein ExbD
MGMSTAGSREINVTPLIDVLLVLLVIFLIIMPVMVRFEMVELPPAQPGVISEKLTMTLKLDADLSVSLDDGARFPYRELATRLRAQLAKISAVFIDSGDGIPWALVVSTIDTVRGVANDVNGSETTVAIRIRGD